MQRVFRILVPALAVIPIFQSPPFLLAGWKSYVPLSINSWDNPGAVDPHSNSGGRRIARIKNTTIAICPTLSGENTYRSINNGLSWTRIDEARSAYSGCLISGPQSMIYHFYKSGNNLYMVRFRYNEDPPAPISILNRSDLSETNTGAYWSVNASVDSNGVLYVATHWGNPDRLYVVRSFNQGSTWSGPYEISHGNGPWYYPHLEVNADNLPVCTYAQFGVTKTEIWFAKSSDHGETWEQFLVGKGKTYNPSLLTLRADTFFVFAQRTEASHAGLVYNRSNDGGETWGGWKLIDPTCGYADPSPALGKDRRTIFVAYRSSNGTGITTGTCGDMCRFRLAMSPDLGATWVFVDDYYRGERTGTRSQIRYQSWWNYGGPLEWIWMQYEKGGSSRPIYYDINLNAEIYQLNAAPGVPAPPAS